MAKQTLNNGETGLVTRGKINNNFTDVYSRIVEVSICNTPGAVSLTNQAVAELEFPNGSTGNRVKFDGTYFSQARLVARVNGLSPSTNDPRLYLQWSTDESSWTTLGTGTGTQAISMSTVGTKATDWINLPSGAKADVFWRVAQIGGDAAADPFIGNMSMELI